MTSTAFVMQSNSANRKLGLKKLADEYHQKYKTLHNILTIKFATYNYEATLAFRDDFEPIAALLVKLINDANVKEKQKSKYRILLNKMKDCRNIINLIAVIGVLKIIAQYQKWGQLEEASVFERKYAKKQLKRRLKLIHDKREIKKVIDEKFSFFDFEKKKMKHCGLSLKFVPRSRNELISQVLKRQKKIGDAFLKHKDEIHKAEDPPFLDELSDIMDVRNWNLPSFDPEDEENRRDGLFEREVDRMCSVLSKCEKFYEDLNNDEVEKEFREVLQIIYESEKQQKNLSRVSKKEHIIDQWTYLRNNIPAISERFQKIWYRLVKRVSIAPNAQSGCERANSTYNQFKTSLSTRMKLPMISARLRIKINGPPLSKFKPKPIRTLWLMKGHQYSETATNKKVVIDRIRSDAHQNYTSKILD